MEKSASAVSVSETTKGSGQNVIRLDALPCDGQEYSAALEENAELSLKGIIKLSLRYKPIFFFPLCNTGFFL